MKLDYTNALQICGDSGLRGRVEEMVKSLKAAPETAAAHNAPHTWAADEDLPPYPHDDDPPAYPNREKPSSSSLSETSEQPGSTAHVDERWIRHEFLCPITQEVGGRRLGSHPKGKKKKK